VNIKIKEKHNVDKPVELSIEKGLITKVTEPNKFIVFLKRWYLLLLTLIIIFSAGIGGYFYISSNLQTSLGSFSANSDSNDNKGTYAPKKVFLESPTNGAWIPEDKFAERKNNKILTVMIENLAGSNGARPQAGLQDADIVYETLAEGDITRFMAVFWNNHTDDTSSITTDKVMPVRSARKYYIDWLMEYNDPLYMHIGQAESEIEATNALGALARYGIKDVSGAGNSFDRDHTCEITKSQEHCAFSDTKTLWDIGKQKGWTGLGDVQMLKYKDDLVMDQTLTYKDATDISVDFLGYPEDYGAKWAYDSATNLYKRSIGSSKMLDQVSGNQITTKTLIVQNTSITVSEDNGKWHKIIKTIGSGDAWIFQDGKSVEATWKKDKLTNRTKYYDKVSGKELSLNRGKMWITVTGKTPVVK